MGKAKEEVTCNNCGQSYDRKEVGRINGKESMVFLLGYCSARCYTHKTLNDKITKEGQKIIKELKPIIDAL